MYGIAVGTYPRKINNITTFEPYDLFKSFLEKGKSYKQLYSVLHYIVDKIQARNYIDENGNLQYDVISKSST